MESLSMSLMELIVSFIAVVLGLAFPVTILVILFAIYNKAKNIEELLKKNQDKDV